HHAPPPLPTSPSTRSDPNNPYPTTFVQADSSSFKQVVQMLTGSAATARLATRPEAPAAAAAGSKLYERRRNALMKSSSSSCFRINTPGPGYWNGSGTPVEALSPSVLDFPSLTLSPVTPLVPDPFNRANGGNLNLAAEEKAIREKGFYLHPSPVNTPRESEPRLLPLFPLTSPR
ncbi:hypothetical protein M569_07104, partial [Genlisea aurea]